MAKVAEAPPRPLAMCPPRDSMQPWELTGRWRIDTGWFGVLVLKVEEMHTWRRRAQLELARAAGLLADYPAVADALSPEQLAELCRWRRAKMSDVAILRWHAANIARRRGGAGTG